MARHAAMHLSRHEYGATILSARIYNTDQRRGAREATRVLEPDGHRAPPASAAENGTSPNRR